MQQLVVLDDELLEKLADYYAHPFVQNNMPWLVEMGFEAFVQREILRMQEELLPFVKSLSENKPL